MEIMLTAVISPLPSISAISRCITSTGSKADKGDGNAGCRSASGVSGGSRGASCGGLSRPLTGS
jgi:hypothetical protein